MRAFLLRTARSVFLGFVSFAIGVSAHAEMVGNAGFEIAEPTGTFLPITAFGDWAGDQSTIVTAENGIVPLKGSRMLRFDSGGSAPGGTYESQVFQAIDVSAYSSLIAAGNAEVVASAWFNRVPGDAETDTLMGIWVYAIHGTLPFTFMNVVGAQLGTVFTDGDVGTWEMATTRYTLPSNTDYVAICLDAAENVHNDSTYPEFDGHYADSVSFTVVPEPSTIALLGSLALCGIGVRRYRRRKADPVLP